MQDEELAAYPTDKSGLRYDPKERDQKFRLIIQWAEKEAEEGLKMPRTTWGYCHAFWPEKKRILKEKHGIDWKTPVELNPDVLFD